MSDPIATMRAAQERRDLLGTANAVLAINGPDPQYRVAAALRALGPHLDDATRTAVAPFLVEEPATPNPSPIFDYSTEPVDLVAWLSPDDRHRAWQQLIRTASRAPLWEATQVNDMPLDLVPDLLQALFDVGKGIVPRLGLFDDILRRYHDANPVASRAWFLRWIGTTGRLAEKVASAPGWTAAVHTPEELSELARMIIANRQP